MFASPPSGAKTGTSLKALVKGFVINKQIEAIA
jgi:hypothetical protein